MAAKIFRINYKSDFILTLNSDAGWMTPFCIKFWTGVPSQAFYAGWDGETYTHCAYDPSEPTKLLVQFDDHHLPIGDLKFQIAYHFTVADFPNDTEDEVINPANITTEIDGQEYQVMLDFTGETAPEIQFSLPAYANEAQRIANEQQRIADEEQRIAKEQTRIDNEVLRISAEQTRQDNEAQRIRNEQTRINQEEARVREFATLKRDAQESTTAANNAAALANQKAQLAADKAQLAADKAALAQDAANLANQKAQLAADKAALAQDAADLANQKAQLAQQKAEYAQSQGDYAKQQGDYAKEQGDYAKRKGDDAAAQMQQQAQAFSEAQAARQTAYEQSEGTESGSVAGDGSRWGAFKTNEAARDAKVDAKVADITNLQEAVAEGAVYDVSAKNPTAGPNNDGKWGSLSALLSDANLNTLIPSAVRRGGMSIKFVLSSDNKYVQYRLMSDSFNTTPANWQGVDDEPTAGSENLVKSGGVNNSIFKHTSKLMGETESFDNYFPELQQPEGNKYVNGDTGNIDSWSGVKAVTVPISENFRKICFSSQIRYSASSNIGYAFYDSSDNPISYSRYDLDLQAQAYRMVPKFLNIPTNAKTFKFTLVSGQIEYYAFQLNNTIADNVVLKSIRDAEEDSKKRNIYSRVIAETLTIADLNGYIDTSGTFVEQEGDMKTYIVPVKRGDVIKSYQQSDTNVKAIAFKKTLEDASFEIDTYPSGLSSSASYIYTYMTNKDGYFFLCSRTNPQIEIYNINLDDDSYFQDKYANQLTIYPHMNQGVYTTGNAAVYNNALTTNNTRITFHIYIKPNDVTIFDFTNDSEVSLVVHSVAYIRGGKIVHNTASNVSYSFLNNVLTFINDSTDTYEALVVFKKSDNSAITESAVQQVHFTRRTEQAYTTENAEFVALMNIYAQRIGMTNSIFVNSYGGDRDGNNVSCVSDILRMAIFAFGKEVVRRFMSISSVTVSVLGEHSGNRNISNNMQTLMDTYYEEMFPGQTNPYTIIAKKGGGWSVNPKAYSLIAFTEIDGNIVCGVTATTQGDGTTGRIARVKGMIELFNISAKVIRGESIEGLSCELVENAISAIAPQYPICYSQLSITPLYSQNPTVTYNPASTSKVLSSIIMTDVLTNLHEYHKIVADDVVNDSTYVAYAGDIETVETSLFAMMLASNAANTISLARLTGHKILESRNSFV